MKLYIPSYKRSKRIITLRDWPENLKVSVVAQHQERKEYEACLSTRGLSCVDLVVMPSRLDDCGLAKTRNFIFDHTGDEDCLMLDDDLYFYRRGKVHGAPIKIRNMETEHYEPAVRLLESWLKEPDIAQVAFGLREGNAMHPEDYAENERACRAIAYKMDVVNRLKYRCRIGSKDDFDSTLVLLRAGFKNRVSMYYVQGHSSSDKAGGCSVYRDDALMRQSCERLAAAHPGVVRIVRVQGRKNGPDRWRDRWDVRISWKKAFNMDARSRVPTLF